MLLKQILCPARQNEEDKPLDVKSAPAFQGTPEKAPLGVARRSFERIKPLSWIGAFSGATEPMELGLTGPSMVTIYCIFNYLAHSDPFRQLPILRHIIILTLLRSYPTSPHPVLNPRRTSQYLVQNLHTINVYCMLPAPPPTDHSTYTSPQSLAAVHAPPKFRSHHYRKSHDYSGSAAFGRISEVLQPSASSGISR